MYLSRPGQPFAAGHESAGVTAPATEWFLAEGATGSFFDLFVLIENPATAGRRRARCDYLLPSGATLTKDYAVRGAEPLHHLRGRGADSGRLGPAAAGVDTPVAMRVTSTNGVPIIVERAMWWPQPAWYEAHNAPGDDRDRHALGDRPAATSAGRPAPKPTS